MLRRTATVLAGLALLSGALTAPAAAKGGAVEGGGSTYYLNDRWSGEASSVVAYGRPGDELYVGDWNGDGTDTPAVRRGNQYHVKNSLDGGRADVVVPYGRALDEVLAGDWDGDGVDTLAVRRGSEYHVKNSLTGGAADVVLHYGRADDIVLVGDWDGDGRDTLAVRRGNVYHLRDDLRGGPAHRTVGYGRVGDEVLVGDWDGNGTDTPSIRRDSVFHVQDTLSGGRAERATTYGRITDTAMAGDWNGDGADTIGLRRPPAQPTWHTGQVTDISGVVRFSGRYDSRNGNLHPSQLCLVPFMPAHYIHCRALGDLVQFDRAYRVRFGERLPVDLWDNSTYRTRAQQDETWAQIGPPVAARPGTSPHGWGLAVDMFEGDAYNFDSARYRWMLTNGPRYGWENKPWHQRHGSVPEYWHFDYVR